MTKKQGQGQGQEPASVIGGQHLAWLRELAARQRFGPRDRLGTANLIDAAARARAAEAIRTGETASLARPLRPGPSNRNDGRASFSVEVFYTDGPVGMGSDHVELDCHGVENTHLDAINHIAIDGTWYNGWPVSGSPDGPDVAAFAPTGLFTRALHLDVAAAQGRAWCDPQRPVGGADLDAACERLGLWPEPGDAVLIDMGRDRYEADGHDMSAPVRPGVGVDGARWLVERDVSVVCWDLLDARHPSEPLAPVHLLNWAIGLLLVDNCDFAAARRTAGAMGALVVAPLAVPGGTGCMVNPLLVV